MAPKRDFCTYPTQFCKQTAAVALICHRPAGGRESGARNRRTRTRIYFADHEHVFEITSSNYGVIRYAAIAGGKPCSIPTSTFETRYKNGEIQCIFAPEKLFINTDSCSTIRRKERYVLTALAKLPAPTLFELLLEPIQEIYGI